MDLLTERLHSPNGGGGAAPGSPVSALAAVSADRCDFAVLRAATGVVLSVGIEGVRCLAVRGTAESELVSPIGTPPLPALRQQA
jgi:hypothetical protein